MTNLVYGLLSVASQPGVGEQRLRELTIAWSRYGYHGPIIEDNNIDSLLRRASDASYDYCLIQKAGHVIDEKWLPPRWQKEGFHDALQRCISEQDFMVAGKWLTSSNGCVGLETTCLLINLKHYKKLGHPLFGQPKNELTEIECPVSKSFQDEKIAAVTEAKTIQPDIAGWNLLQTSLQYHLPIQRLPKAMRSGGLNLNGNASNDDSPLLKLVGKPLNGYASDNSLNDDQIVFLNNIDSQINDAQRGVFLWNIESYNDLQSSPDQPPLDAVASVAAGFKPNRILHTQGFHNKTEVIFFDYSQQALDIRREMVERWNGENFPDFVRQLFKTHPYPETFYQLWSGVTPDTVDWQDIKWFWQRELERWGGPAEFQKHWLAAQQLQHHYIHCNLLTDAHILLEKIRNLEQVYLWWSNAFFTVNSHWFYNMVERKQHYEQWITALAEANPNTRINGADYNNVAVNGITAGEYLAAYHAQPCDALNPRQRHQVSIQF